MRTLADWFTEYGKSHQNQVNQKIHWVFVPAIYLSIVALIWQWQPMVAICLLIVTTFYYLVLSRSIGVGMLVFNCMVIALVLLFQMLFASTIVTFMLVLFVAAWIGQFVGHKIEGAKPSFFDDLQFLLVGPAWVLSHLYDYWNVRY